MGEFAGLSAFAETGGVVFSVLLAGTLINLNLFGLRYRLVFIVTGICVLLSFLAIWFVKSKVQAPVAVEAEPSAHEARHGAERDCGRLPMPDTRLQQGDASRATWQMKAFRLALRVVYLFLFRVRIIGMENLPARNVIFCGNHLGWAEGFLGLLFLPVEPRLYILGDRHVAYDSPTANRLINWLQFFVPVDRDDPGTRPGGHGRRHPARWVAGHRARRPIGPPGGDDRSRSSPARPFSSQRTGAPLLPVGVTGTLELWWRCTLTMRIGKPIDPGEFSGCFRKRVRGHDRPA